MDKKSGVLVFLILVLIFFSVFVFVSGSNLIDVMRKIIEEEQKDPGEAERISTYMTSDAFEGYLEFMKRESKEKDEAIKKLFEHNDLDDKAIKDLATELTKEQKQKISGAMKNTEENAQENYHKFLSEIVKQKTEGEEFEIINFEDFQGSIEYSFKEDNEFLKIKDNDDELIAKLPIEELGKFDKIENDDNNVLLKKGEASIEIGRGQTLNKVNFEDGEREITILENGNEIKFNLGEKGKIRLHTHESGEGFIFSGEDTYIKSFAGEKFTRKPPVDRMNPLGELDANKPSSVVKVDKGFIIENVYIKNDDFILGGKDEVYVGPGSSRDDGLDVFDGKQVLYDSDSNNVYFDVEKIGKNSGVYFNPLKKGEWDILYFDWLEKNDFSDQGTFRVSQDEYNGIIVNNKGFHDSRTNQDTDNDRTGVHDPGIGGHGGPGNGGGGGVGEQILAALQQFVEHLAGLGGAGGGDEGTGGPGEQYAGPGPQVDALNVCEDCFCDSMGCTDCPKQCISEVFELDQSQEDFEIQIS